MFPDVPQTSTSKQCQCNSTCVDVSVIPLFGPVYTRPATTETGPSSYRALPYAPRYCSFSATCMTCSENNIAYTILLLKTASQRENIYGVSTALELVRDLLALPLIVP
eukprot:5645694-Pyramimonas_sp.AAC.1